MKEQEDEKRDELSIEQAKFVPIQNMKENTRFYCTKTITCCQRTTLSRKAKNKNGARHLGERAGLILTKTGINT